MLSSSTAVSTACTSPRYHLGGLAPFRPGHHRRAGLPCEIRREHFFAHRPDAPYDAIVNLGVTEHLPDYERTLASYRTLLRPGGRVYLDASATRAKNRVTTFFENQIFRGNGTPLSLKSYTAALSRSPLELEVVLNDRVNYGITTRRWAENLDAAHATVEERWGSRQYRLFRLVPLGMCRRILARRHPGLPNGAPQSLRK